VTKSKKIGNFQIFSVEGVLTLMKERIIGSNPFPCHRLFFSFGRIDLNFEGDRLSGFFREWIANDYYTACFWGERKV
jgi:hypothetical protein